MKKFLAIVISAVMTLSICACGGGANDTKRIDKYMPAIVQNFKDYRKGYRINKLYSKSLDKAEDYIVQYTPWAMGLIGKEGAYKVVDRVYVDYTVKGETTKIVFNFKEGWKEDDGLQASKFLTPEALAEKFKEDDNLGLVDHSQSNDYYVKILQDYMTEYNRVLIPEEDELKESWTELNAKEYFKD